MNIEKKVTWKNLLVILRLKCILANSNNQFSDINWSETESQSELRQNANDYTVEKTSALAPGSLRWILFRVLTTASTLVEWLPFEHKGEDTLLSNKMQITVEWKTNIKHFIIKSIGQVHMCLSFFILYLLEIFFCLKLQKFQNLYPERINYKSTPERHTVL